MAIKRIGILTDGGDVPGRNAVIKSATYRSSENDIEIFGLRRGCEASRRRLAGACPRVCRPSAA
jgi:ATP-dependent phosphofructokinase / diphosphate-dependent phosphofructokinase